MQIEGLGGRRITGVRREEGGGGLVGVLQSVCKDRVEITHCGGLGGIGGGAHFFS